MNLTDVESQVLVQRLSRPKFFDQVFTTPYASSAGMSIVSLGMTIDQRQYFGVLLRPGHRISSRRRGRSRRWDLERDVETLVRGLDPNVVPHQIRFVVLNDVAKDGFLKEKHQPIIEAAIAANPAAVKACMRGGKFQRSTGILSEKETRRKRIFDLQKEISQLKKIAVVDTWNLRHIANDAGKYVASAIASELKAKFGNRLEDIELKFAYPQSADTAGQTMLNCLDFFTDAFGSVDQNALFTFLARSQDQDYRRWCALAAPSNFLLPLLIDADPVVRECAKMNKERVVVPTLNRLRDLELELKKLEEHA